MGRSALGRNHPQPQPSARDHGGTLYRPEPAAGGTTTPQAVDVTATFTPAFARVTGKLVALALATSLVLVRTTNKTVTRTATLAAVVTRETRKVIDRTATFTVAVQGTLAGLIQKSVQVSSTFTAAITRSTQKLVEVLGGGEMPTAAVIQADPGNATGGGGAGGVDLEFPGNTTPGNLVVIAAMTDDTVNTPQLDTPAGWTRLGTDNGSGTLDAGIFYKEADGTTMATSVESGGGANNNVRQGAMVEYDLPFDLISSFDAGAQTNETSTVTSESTNGAPTAEDWSLAIAVLATQGAVGGTTPVITVDNGFTVDKDFNTGTNANSRGTIASRVVTDGSNPSTTFSWTTARAAKTAIGAFSVPAQNAWTVHLTTASVFGKLVALGATLDAAVTRAVGKAISRTATYSAVLTRTTGRVINRTATFAPAVTRQARVFIDRVVSFVPEVARRTLKAIAATATMTAAVVWTRTFGRIISATATFAPAVVRVTNKVIDRTATFLAALTAELANEVFPKAINLGATFAATVTRSTSKVLDRSVAYLATTTRVVGKGVAFGASFAVAVTRGVAKTIALSSVFTVAVQSIKAFVKLVQLTASFAPAVARQTARAFERTATFTAAVVKSSTRTLATTTLLIPAFVRSIGKRVLAYAVLNAGSGAGELMVNGDMANATLGFPTWYASWVGGVNPNPVTTYVDDGGNQVLALSQNTATTNASPSANAGHRDVGYILTAGGRHHLSLRVKASRANQTYQAIVAWYDAALTGTEIQLQTLETLQPGDGWVSRQYAFVLPATAIKVNVQFRGTGQNAVGELFRIDDVKLTRTDGPTVTKSTTKTLAFGALFAPAVASVKAFVKLVQVTATFTATLTKRTAKTVALVSQYVLDLFFPGIVLWLVGRLRTRWVQGRPRTRTDTGDLNERWHTHDPRSSD